MKWGKWSTTAASNSATPPDGWPEGQAPSTVNDCAREMMASIRTGISDVGFVDLDFSPTFATANTFTVPNDQTAYFHYGRRVKASDATTLYGTVISSSFTTNTGVTIRLDGWPLTASLSAIAVGFPSQQNTSLPDNVYRHRNFFRNAALEFWNRGDGPFSFSSMTVLAYTADGWCIGYGITSAGPTAAVSRSERSANASNVPTLAQAGTFLGGSIVISSNNAVGGLSASDFLTFGQRIEGYEYRNLAGKPINISFWVNSTLTGTYCIALGNSGSDRSMVMEYSISSAGAWEFKTVQFSEPPTAGTWDYSAGIGINVRWTLAAGSTYRGGGGNWTAVNLLATTNQVNFMGGAGRSIKFAGMKIEEGTENTPLEQFNMAEEANRNGRFLQKITAERINAQAANTSLAVAQWMHSPQMERTPSISFIATVSQMVVSNFSGTPFSVSAITVANVTARYVAFNVVAVGAPLTAAGGAFFQLSAGSIIMKSEL